MSTGVLASTNSLVSIGTGPTTSGLLETGAASGPASSGGALVDADGNVTGIVLSPVGDSRMTYAVPIDTALSIADDLDRGIRPARRTRNQRDRHAAGPTVTAVAAGGPARLAGMRVGDIVESVDKHDPIRSKTSWRSFATTRPARPVVVEFGADRARSRCWRRSGTWAPR